MFAPTPPRQRHRARLALGAGALATAFTFGSPVDAVEDASDASVASLDGGASADAGMNPPEEDDPGGSCSCFWKDELPEGTAALGLPWVLLAFVRRATRPRR